MKSEKAKKIISKLPDEPGVYFFLHGKKILYIGKATSLKDRVRSYLSTDISETRSPLISKMLSEFTNIKFQKTDSVLEALILEANLIKKYQPEANVDLKDDKSFNYVVITKENFPRVLVIRGRELEKFFFGTPLEKHGYFSAEKFLVLAPSRSQGFSWDDASKNFSLTRIFGPFPNAGQLREAMKIVRKMFPYRDECTPAEEQKFPKPCFNRQIGLCPGVCTGEISKKDYAKQIKNIILFFEGNKKKLVRNLEKEMKKFARAREFEKAGEIKRQIFALRHIQDVSLIKNEVSKGTFDMGGFRIEGYDIAHISGADMVGAMVVVESGEAKKSDYRKFKIKGQTGADDTKALSEIISRRLAHIEWPLPNLIVVDGGKAQIRAAEKILNENRINIPVISVVKDEKHKPRGILGDKKWLKYESEILLANAEAHRFALGFHKKLRGAKF